MGNCSQVYFNACAVKVLQLSFPGEVNNFTTIVLFVLLERFTIHKESNKEYCTIFI